MAPAASPRQRPRPVPGRPAVPIRASERHLLQSPPSAVRRGRTPHDHDRPVGADNHLQVPPVSAVFAGIERAIGLHPVDEGLSVPSMGLLPTTELKPFIKA